jgi:hypothetical protein
MKANDFDWQFGDVRYWNLDFIDLHRPFEEQVDDLTEDLAQISFSNGRMIDIGWYPSMAEDGCFVISVVENENWDDLLAKMRCVSKGELIEGIAKAVTIAVGHHEALL